MHRSARRHITLIAVIFGAVVLGAAGAVALALATGVGSDDAARSAVDLTKITPLPFKGLPATVAPPDIENVLKCQLPADERPSPNLPPLSGRSTGAEPPQGAIPTADANAQPTIQGPQDGGTQIDNPLFRFTVQLPEAWYSDMRPEGGAFKLRDAIATSEDSDYTKLPGGISITFSARQYFPPRDPDHFQPAVEEWLKAPNTTFGSYVGVIRDEGAGEGAAHILHAAFTKGGIVFEIYANVEDDAPPGTIAANVNLANAVISSVTPY